MQRVPTPKPPTVTVSPAQYRQAGLLYEHHCAICHGTAGVAGGVLPDLRRSVRLQRADEWRRVVVDGDLAPRGMPRFGRYVSAADAELIRAYVARQAVVLYEAEASQSVGRAPERAR
jgi:quinohemoprotein ethanol dehydrogenase